MSRLILKKRFIVFIYFNNILWITFFLVEPDSLTPAVKHSIKSAPFTTSEIPLAPDSGQRLRLRGATSKGPWEGYLEFRQQKDQKWGHVCVPKDKWTFNEANTVCRHLGFEW